jgi:hypothetical protein
MYNIFSEGCKFEDLVLSNGQFIVKARLRVCDDFVELYSVDRVGIIYSGNDYVLVEVVRNNEVLVESTVRTTNTISGGKQMLIGEAILFVNKRAVPKCGKCPSMVRDIRSKLLSGWDLYIVIDITNRKLLRVEAIPPNETRRILHAWSIR